MKPTTEDDARWLAMILEGGHKESKALTEIQAQYAAMVKDHILKNKGDLEEAKDVLQISLITLVEAIHNHKYRKEASIKNYLMGIVRKQWLTRLKRKGIFVTWDYPSEEAWEVPDAPPELELTRREGTRKLIRLLHKLHEGCFAIFKMLYWYGWPHAKIAKLLGLPSPDASKTKKHRCTEELRRFLSNHPDLAAELKELIQWD